MSTAEHLRLARIQAKLDRWELEHLRQHAAELAERLEAAEAATRRAEEQASHAEDTADFWREQALGIELRDDESLGLTRSGDLVVLKAANQSPAHRGAH